MKKKRLLGLICSIALVVGLMPMTALADDDEIITDVVIHKLKVTTGTQLQSHNGKEIQEDLDTIEGVIFKYWKVSETVTDAQLSQLKGLSTIEEVERFIANNANILTDGQALDPTDGNGQTMADALEEGMYFFVEVNGAELNISEYIGVPFLLELPAMHIDGEGYFGTAENALHIYPKNVVKQVGVEVETVNESGTRIGESKFKVETKKTGGNYELASLGANGEIVLSNGVIVLTEIPAGEYRLVNTKAPDGYMTDNRPIYFSVSAGALTYDSQKSNPDASFAAKTNDTNDRITLPFKKVPEVTKEESSGGTAQVGQIVTWTIKADIPNPFDAFEKFNFTDQIDSRLDFMGNIKVVANSNGTENELIEDTHFTQGFANSKMTIIFDVDELKDYAGHQLVITYDTTINETAIMGEEIPNNVELDFDNGQGHESKEKPTTPPTVWTGGYKWVKLDGSNKEVTLEGAEFKIATNAEGTDFIEWTEKLIEANDSARFVTPVVGEDIIMKSGTDGIFEIKGLAGGTYYLVETKAPNIGGKQYNLLREPAEFEVIKTSYVVDASAFHVENNSGLQIPQTGGIGTIVFTVVGVGLMTLAIVLLRKRKNKEMPSTDKITTNA